MKRKRCVTSFSGGILGKQEVDDIIFRGFSDLMLLIFGSRMSRFFLIN